MEKPRFWVAPGDGRQAAIARHLGAAGLAQAGCGEADWIVLPTPLSAGESTLSAALLRAKAGAVLTAGGVGPVHYAAAGAGGRLLIDYALREDFAWKNAVLTAEGTVGLLLGRRPEGLFGATALVVGYGRIGRVLAARLLPFGVYVTAAARRAAGRAEAEAMGCRAVDMAGLARACAGASIVLNTVPAPVLGADALSALPPGATVLDLASAPGGVDFEAARALSLDACLCPGLPARTAPEAAGRIAAETILQLMREREVLP